MSTSRHIHTIAGISANLIGEIQHRHYISLQAAYGVAQRGGVVFSLYEEKHNKRLISNVNLLSPQEHRQLVFSELIFSN